MSRNFYFEASLWGSHTLLLPFSLPSFFCSWSTEDPNLCYPLPSLSCGSALWPGDGKGHSAVPCGLRWSSGVALGSVKFQWYEISVMWNFTVDIWIFLFIYDLHEYMLFTYNPYVIGALIYIWFSLDTVCHSSPLWLGHLLAYLFVYSASCFHLPTQIHHSVHPFTHSVFNNPWFHLFILHTLSMYPSFIIHHPSFICHPCTIHLTIIHHSSIIHNPPSPIIYPPPSILPLPWSIWQTPHSPKPHKEERTFSYHRVLYSSS